MNKDDLLRLLNERAKGLLYMSESDYPLKPFYGTQQEVGAAEMSPQALTLWRKLASDAPIEEMEFAAFFEPAVTPEDWHGDEEKASVAGFQALAKALAENLSGLRVYKVGEAEKEVFVMGTTASGDFAGVMTKVVET